MTMKLSILAAATAAVAVLCLPSLAAADDDSDGRDDVAIAVIGDWPYSQQLLDNAHLLVDSVNASDARLLIHVGDIHSGSMPCTSAGILPPIATSNPGWNQAVFNVFQQFRVPVVYTPGDNEWADCHKTKQLKSGQPLSRRLAVRRERRLEDGRRRVRDVQRAGWVQRRCGRVDERLRGCGGTCTRDRRA